MSVSEGQRKTEKMERLWPPLEPENDPEIQRIIRWLDSSGKKAESLIGQQEPVRHEPPVDPKSYGEQARSFFSSYPYSTFLYNRFGYNAKVWELLLKIAIKFMWNKFFPVEERGLPLKYWSPGAVDESLLFPHDSSMSSPVEPDKETTRKFWVDGLLKGCNERPDEFSSVVYTLLLPRMIGLGLSASVVELVRIISDTLIDYRNSGNSNAIEHLKMIKEETIPLMTKAIEEIKGLDQNYKKEMLTKLNSLRSTIEAEIRRKDETHDLEG